MKARVLTTGPEHEAFYQDFLSFLKKHAGHLSAEEMLAIASNAVGKIIAMQDQRSMTHERALAIVAENIEAGNAQALREVLASRGTA